MTERPVHPRGPDRRRQPRGGRRPEDRDGFAPLVLLVGQDGMVEKSEAILAKLKFAVSTSNTVDDALRVMPQLRPDLVVAAEQDGKRLRLEAPQHVPVVVMRTGTDSTPEALIEEIRQTLRGTRAS